MSINTDQKTSTDRVRIFRGLDLNLFVVFSVIYAKGTITGASEVLGITQSAASHALSRLRASLNDELFVRRGASMVATPFAKSIIDDVHIALDRLSNGALGFRQFEPNTSSLNFCIATTPGIEIFLLPPLLALLKDEAPNITIISEHLSRAEVETRFSRGDLDFAISMDPPMYPEIRRYVLRKDKFITVTHKDNPIVQNGLTQEAYLAAKHILISSYQSGGGLEEIEFARLGVKRNVVARCGTITSAVQSAVTTNYLLTLGSQKFEVLAEHPDLAVFDFPFPTHQALEGFLLWDESMDDDPANCWMRAKIIEILEEKETKA
jgi:DNA-binding transcriptional LysR family regulator